MQNTILKSAKIGSNNIIVANSTITNSVFVENCIIKNNSHVLKNNIIR